jgi:hypothetical protein
MISVAIINEEGKVLLPKDLATPRELRAAASLATSLARECERLAKLQEPKEPGKGSVPYLG